VIDQLHILHLEDDPADAHLIGIYLANEELPHEIRWVQDKDSFRAALEEGPFDIILADYSVPGFSGLEALNWVQASHPELPFVFVSGSIGEERAIECLKLGARDYVLKERPARLVPVIRRAVAEARAAQERFWAEAELEAATQRQRVLLEATCAAGVVPWAIQDQHITLGDSACTLLNLPPDSLPQTLKELEQLIHPEDRTSVRRAFEHVLQGGSSTFECRMQSADSRYIWTRWTRHRHPTSMGGIFKDVHEQHRLQEQLIQTQKMESLGALAGRVAHDFNNILQAIALQSEILATRGGFDSTQSKGLEAIHLAGERGVALIRQLMSFSRDVTLHRIPTNLNALVREIHSLLRGTMGAQVKLEVLLEEELPCVMADSDQLHQVLMNLVVNARDALSAQGGLICIGGGTTYLSEEQATLQRRPSGSYAYLEVEDDGSGIPEEVMTHIFEPYFTTKGDKGTGLGLYVVCGIAEAHGGWLDCDSEPGRGTRFRLFLPFVVASAPADGVLNTPAGRSPG
jgi:signal transduction histidine kinase